MPFAVAMEKGMFKAEGANVTGILSSPGGGTTLRNMLAGSAPFAEVNPNAVIAAIQQGAKYQDCQRRRADGGGIRLGREAELADPQRRAT